VQRIHFSASEPFLTGDDLAHALLDYAWALAEYRRHDLVRVPGIRIDDQSPTVVTLLVGPVAQLSAVRVDVPEELHDATVEADLRVRTTRLRGLPSTSFDGNDWNDQLD
jgi:hypothetical protein